jgi:hypothetical protein
MWSVSNRTGTSNSQSAVTSTPNAGGVPKVTSPVVVSTDQPDSCSTPSRYTFTVPATGLVVVRTSMTLPDG